MRFHSFQLLVLFICFSIVFSCTEQPKTYTITDEELEALNDSFTYEIENARFSDESPPCWIHLYAESDIIPPPDPEPIHKEMFAGFSQLRQQFSGNVLENNFQILRNLTNSQSYIVYLIKAFPRDASFKTLDEFWKEQPPPTERLLPLFDGLLENPNDKQIAYAHFGILSWQCITIDSLMAPGFAGKCETYPISIDTHPKTSTAVENTAHFGHRQLLLNLVPDEHWENHRVNILQKRYQKSAEVTLDLNRKKIQGFFNEYGVNNGLIWLAIQEPDLTGFILSNFSNEKVFQGWVNHFWEE